MPPTTVVRSYADHGRKVVRIGSYIRPWWPTRGIRSSINHPEIGHMPEIKPFHGGCPMTKTDPFPRKAIPELLAALILGSAFVAAGQVALAGGVLGIFAAAIVMQLFRREADWWHRETRSLGKGLLLLAVNALWPLLRARGFGHHVWGCSQVQTRAERPSERSGAGHRRPTRVSSRAHAPVQLRVGWIRRRARVRRRVCRDVVD